MFQFVHGNFLWGEPHCVYDCCLYKLTEEEIARLPPSDYFFNHREVCHDAHGVPESLQVEFLPTNVGTRLCLDRCRGVILHRLRPEN